MIFPNPRGPWRHQSANSSACSSPRPKCAHDRRASAASSANSTKPLRSRARISAIMSSGTCAGSSPLITGLMTPGSKRMSHHSCSMRVNSSRETAATTPRPGALAVTPLADLRPGRPRSRPVRGRTAPRARGAAQTGAQYATPFTRRRRNLRAR